jgi:hypothetical protein
MRDLVKRPFENAWKRWNRIYTSSEAAGQSDSPRFRLCHSGGKICCSELLRNHFGKFIFFRIVSNLGSGLSVSNGTGTNHLILDEVCWCTDL